MTAFRRGAIVTVYEDPLTEIRPETTEAVVRRCFPGSLGDFYDRSLRRRRLRHYEVAINGVGVVERNILDRKTNGRRPGKKAGR